MKMIENIKGILMIALSIIIFIVLGIFGIIGYNEYLKDDNTIILDSLTKQRLELIDINADLDTVDINLDSIKKDVRKLDSNFDNYNRRLDTFNAKIEIIYEEVNKSNKTLGERILSWFN